MKPAVFLDRDGTIIQDQHYPRDPEKVAFLDKAVEGLQLMQQKGYPLFVISNQSGVARGIISQEQFRAVHQRFLEILEGADIQMNDFAYCFHHPKDECNCRKPAPGLIKGLIEGHQLEAGKSFMIGDKVCDLKLADAVSATGYLVLTGHGQKSKGELDQLPDKDKYTVCENLLEIAEKIPSLNH